MNTPDDLLPFARARIDDCPTRTADSGEVKDGAAALLADLLVVGLRHGITPADWAAVAALPTSCLGACRQRLARAAYVVPKSPGRPTCPTSTGSEVAASDRTPTNGITAEAGASIHQDHRLLSGVVQAQVVSS